MSAPFEACYDADIYDDCVKRLNDTGSCAGCPIWESVLARADAEHDRQKEED